jgi:hypothetical protein
MKRKSLAKLSLKKTTLSNLETTVQKGIQGGGNTKYQFSCLDTCPILSCNGTCANSCPVTCFSGPDVCGDL